MIGAQREAVWGRCAWQAAGTFGRACHWTTGLDEQWPTSVVRRGGAPIVKSLNFETYPSLRWAPTFIANSFDLQVIGYGNGRLAEAVTPASLKTLESPRPSDGKSSVAWDILRVG